jgi:hypothetical protein
LVLAGGTELSIYQPKHPSPHTASPAPVQGAVRSAGEENAANADREVLLAAAGAIARAGGLEPTLEGILGAIAGHLEIESGVVVVPDENARLGIVATTGLGEGARTGLAAAIGNPAHPIARTMATTEASFDVLPTAPGGPALRSHLPLVVTRDGADTVLGVLALAHERPVGPSARPVLLACADLAAVAVERLRLP